MAKLMISEMRNSQLWRDLAAAFGWGEAELARLARYGAELTAAILADRRPGGPRQQRVKDSLRREFGADQHALDVLEYEDRTWQREGFQPKGGPALRAARAEYVALLLA